MELKRLLEELNEFRSAKSFGNENKLFNNVECQILLERCIQMAAGNGSGNSKSFEDISRRSDELNLGMLKQYLLWLMSAKLLTGGWEDTEKTGFTDNFEIFDKGLDGIGTVTFKEFNLYKEEARQTLVRAGVEKEYMSKMNSSIFWNAYKIMSAELETVTNKSKEGHTIKALEKLREWVIKKKELKPETDKEIKAELLLKSLIKEAAEERAESFKKFINDFNNETHQRDQSGKPLGLEEKDYRWKYKDTINRGVYHTPHCFAERNILARCLLLINGINPYYDEESRLKKGIFYNKESSVQVYGYGDLPLQKGIFELEALVSFMETRVARWKAREYFCGAMEQNCENLKNVVKVFEIYLRLHKANSEIEKEKKKKPNEPENIRGTLLYKKDELISLNQLAFITGLKKATIQNFAKSYEEEGKLLVSVPKSKINKEDQNLYKSRCFDVKSVVLWIKEKKYNIKDSAIVSMIPLELIYLEKEVDVGLLEILNP